MMDFFLIFWLSVIAFIFFDVILYNLYLKRYVNLLTALKKSGNNLYVIRRIK